MLSVDVVLNRWIRLFVVVGLWSWYFWLFVLCVQVLVSVCCVFNYLVFVFGAVLERLPFLDCIVLFVFRGAYFARP